MKLARLKLDYTQNGGVLYAAGVDYPADAHITQLIADGVEGEIVDEPIAGADLVAAT
jgi:glycerophosphoryl diester phosphodiesterase